MPNDKVRVGVGGGVKPKTMPAYARNKGPPLRTLICLRKSQEKA